MTSNKWWHTWGCAKPVKGLHKNTCLLKKQEQELSPGCEPESPYCRAAFPIKLQQHVVRRKFESCHFLFCLYEGKSLVGTVRLATLIYVSPSFYLAYS